MVKSINHERLLTEAARFIRDCYRELGLPQKQQGERIREIEEEIRRSGTYAHTRAELVHGAKMAWRNSNRCLGRLLWETLEVFDERETKTAEEAYDKLTRHIRHATNGGNIRSTITVFPPRKDGTDRLRIRNHQLIRYAGYRKGESVIGDPAAVGFTQTCERLGWRGEGTPFDVLPLVI